MNINFEQLDAQLRRGLAPVYLISGDEPLQVQEAADAVRVAARAQGFSERTVMHVETGFDWNELLAAASEMSLFADRKVLDLRMPGGKPGKPGGEALKAYAENPSPDNLLLITTGRLDKPTQNTAWYKALDKAGVSLSIWPPKLQELPAWIERRMRAKGMQPEREACALIAERVEGNLLAAQQEIEKLYILHGAARVNRADVAAAVADSARFDAFTLIDSALQGKVARVARIAGSLRSEGEEVLKILGALGREVRSLTLMAHECAAGEKVDAVLNKHRVWQARKSLVRGGLTRHTPAQWDGLLKRCAHLDRVCKGAARGNAWDELLQLALAIAGADLTGPANP